MLTRPYFPRLVQPVNALDLAETMFCAEKNASLLSTNASTAAVDITAFIVTSMDVCVSSCSENLWGLGNGEGMKICNYSLLIKIDFLQSFLNQTT